MACVKRWSAIFMVLTVSFLSIPSPNAFATSRNCADLLATSISQVGFQVLKAIATNGQNAVVGPRGLAELMTLIRYGADPGSTTEQQITNFLQLQSGLTSDAVAGGWKQLRAELTRTNSGVVIKNDSFVFADQGNVTLNPDFVSLLQTGHGATLAAVNLSNPATASEINELIESRTGIKRFFQHAFEPNARIVLVNTDHTAVQWTQPFNKNETTTSDFKLSNGSKAAVRMMHGKSNFSIRQERDGFGMLRLPFGRNDEGAMYVVLPRTGESTSDLLRRMDTVTFDQWTQNLNSENADVYIPRFRVENNLDLTAMLKGYMPAAFGDDARFTSMGQAKGGVLAIAKVLLNGSLTVTEEGAVGTQAASAIMATRSMSPQFRVDRPFVVVLRDEVTNAILYTAVVENPVDPDHATPSNATVAAPQAAAPGAITNLNGSQSATPVAAVDPAAENKRRMEAKALERLQQEHAGSRIWDAVGTDGWEYHAFNAYPFHKVMPWKYGTWSVSLQPNGSMTVVFYYKNQARARRWMSDHMEAIYDAAKATADAGVVEGEGFLQMQDIVDADTKPLDLGEKVTRCPGGRRILLERFRALLENAE